MPVFAFAFRGHPSLRSRRRIYISFDPCHRPPTSCINRNKTYMPDWLVLALIFVGYVLLMKWVLPKLGVPT